MNRKRVQRLWREGGLRVPLKRRKRQRLGDSAVPAGRLRAERPNHVWALDFQSDQTADGRVLKLLNIVDEHTREALAIVAARRINADATAATLDRIVAVRGTAPGYIRCERARVKATGAGFRLGQVAGPQELAHLTGEGGAGLDAAQKHAPLRQRPARILGRCLEAFLTLLVLPEPGQDVVDLQVRGLDGVPEPVHPAAHLGQLRLDALELRPLLAGHAVHLLVEHPPEAADLGPGEDVLPDLVDDQPLEALRVEARRLAGSAAPLSRERQT